MNIACIRGATTVKENTNQNILEATTQLLQEIIKANDLDLEQIILVIFTSTKDLNEVYPAVAARNIGFNKSALMCMQEMYVKNSLSKCIRVMIQIQSEKSQSEIKHIYLNEAKILRPDLS